MYSPVMQSPVKEAISFLRHAITDVFHNTIDLVVPVVVGVAIVGGLIVIAFVAYRIMSMQGHRLERPDPLE